jgi:DNA-binding MarR family transcriptional regulator
MTTEPSGSLLREMTRLYVRAQRSAADCCGTSPTQCQVLTELSRTGPIPLGELGKRLCLEKSWIGRAVDGLVAEGLVSRTQNPHDSRSWLVRLSATGKRRHKALNDQIEAHAERVMARITPNERAGVNRSLAILLHALREDVGFAPSCCAVAVDGDAVAA